jgi:hypothetical protein
MKSRRLRSLARPHPLLGVRAAVAIGIVACGGSTAPATVAGGGGSFSASIDGTAWTADAATAEARHAQPGKYVLSGTKITGASSLGLEIDLYNISGPGTYPLGVGDKVFGGVGWVLTAQPPTYWLTPNDGASGTVTITGLTATRIAGSFSYTAPAYTIVGNATGTRLVTGGSFDLPIRVTGTVGPVATNAGGKMSAVIGGSAWNAANINVTTGGALKISGDNSNYLVGINLTSVTGPGSYTLTMSPLRLLTVGGPSTNPTGINCCWGGWVTVVNTVPTLADVGTVNITQFGNGRVVGTFGAVLAGVPNTHAPGQLVIANGSFDVGIP